MLDMSPQNLRKYLYAEGDRIPGQVVLFKLNKLGCDINWLLFGAQDSNVQNIFTSLIQVPVYESVHAGTKNNVVSESPAYYIAIPKTNDETIFGVKVTGNSMTSFRIPDGAVVLCSKKEAMINGKPHLVSWNNGESVLRIVNQDGNYFLLTSSDANAYPPLRVHKKEIHFIYRVVKILIEP